MTVTPIKTEAEAALIAAYQGLAGRLPGAAPVKALREAAFEALTAKGLPHRRVEAWHYTDLKANLRDVKPFAAPTVLTAVPAPVLAGVPRLVLADGAYRADLSAATLPEGVTFTPFAEVLAEGRSEILDLLAGPDIARGDEGLGLNALFMTDGVVIEVAAGVDAGVLELTHIVSGAPRSVATRSVIVLGEGATLGLVETVETGAGHQVHDALHVVLAKGAHLQQARKASDDRAGLSLSSVTAELGEAAKYETFTLGTRAALSRRQYFAAVKGNDAHIRIDGANLLAGTSHSDTTLVIDHDALRTESRELIRSVVGGEAKGVFQGKVIVRPGAQKTDGRMASNALLLTERAEMANKPELEIYADDVQCAHGATCGEIDETALFYLRSRGLPQAEAEALLIRAYVAEVAETVGVEGPLAAVGEPLRAALEAAIDELIVARQEAR